MSNLSYNVTMPVDETYDVMVSGGGPSGVAAAIAAARQGLRVLLVERSGQLGGMGTSGGAARLLGGRTPNNKQWAVKGIFLDVVNRLVERGGAVHPEKITAERYNPHGGTGFITSVGYGVPFDPIAMVTLLDELMLEYGVDVLFFTDFVDVVVEDGAIRQLLVANKSGLRAYSAKAFVDATGDADIAARGGCDCVVGRASDHKTTQATLLFHVDNVWQDALKQEIYRSDSPHLQELVVKLREQGIWTFPYNLVSSVQLTDKGTLLINATRLREVDGTDGPSVSRAMMRGRLEVRELFDVMRKHFPGFANARIRSIASMLGVRESRRIVGDFVYTTMDVVAGKAYADTIGFSAYTWDLPDPEDPNRQPMADRRVLRRHSYTPIPYRVMIPRPLTNLICPGRSVSVDRDVLGILRVQAPCYAMGEAAGTAAADVAREEVAFREVDVDELRKSLRELGALVDWEPDSAAE